MSVLVVAAAQLPACGDDPENNLAVVEAAIAEAAAAGADLVVLPELVTTPYFAGEPAGVYREWAEPVPGPQSDRIATLAAHLGITVVLPLFENDATAATFHNSAVVLNRGALVPAIDRTGQSHPVARKLHLPVGDAPAPGFDEPAHFTAGNWLGVHNLDGYRMGALVCYDRRFPESWRELRALGADLVAVPVAGSGGDSTEFFHGELRTHATRKRCLRRRRQQGRRRVGGRTPDRQLRRVLCGRTRRRAHRQPAQGRRAWSASRRARRGLAARYPSRLAVFRTPPHRSISEPAKEVL